MHEHIKDLTRRLAKLGYYAIATELYARQGDPSKYTEIPKLISEVVSKVPDGQVLSDLDASVAFAKSEKADTAKLAVTGFCWGGRQTWLYTAYNPAVWKAGAAWYGQLAPANAPPGVVNPIDVADKIKGPRAWPLWRRRRRHSAAERRSDARSVEKKPAIPRPTSWSIRIRRTPSTPTTVRAIGRTSKRCVGKDARLVQNKTVFLDACCSPAWFWWRRPAQAGRRPGSDAQPG